MLDDYRGEIFRRASDGAELIVAPPRQDRANLDCRWNPFRRTRDRSDLVLLDADGQPVAQQRVAGLQLRTLWNPAHSRTHPGLSAGRARWWVPRWMPARKR